MLVNWGIPCLIIIIRVIICDEIILCRNVEDRAEVIIQHSRHAFVVRYKVTSSIF